MSTEWLLPRACMCRKGEVDVSVAISTMHMFGPKHCVI